MALRYVRSGAGGAATGADWANAYLTLVAALTASAAGDTIFVSEDHAETQASNMALTSPGTAASPIKVVCVNHSGSVPPVSADIRATATVTTTANNSISIAGTPAIYDGIIFSATSGGSSGGITVLNAVNGTVKLRNCALRIAGTNTGSAINLGSTGAGGSAIEMENTTLQFGNVSQRVVVNCDVTWKNTPSAITGAVFPTNLFTFSSARGARVDCRGVDLSALDSGKTIFDANSGQIAVQTLLTDCKINSSVTVGSTPSARGQGGVDYCRVDSGGTNYKHGRIRYEGTQTEETTIVHTGGASDGTTPIAEKMVTTANCSEHFPFEALPISIWNDTTGSAITVTMEGIWGGGSVPNNDDIWLEAEYLGDASSPLGSFVNNGKADTLASNAALSAGTGTWGGSTTKFALAVTFTPQQKGPIQLRVKAAKASSTFYIDPKPTISGVTVSKTQIPLPGVIVNELQASGGGHIATRQQLGM